VKIEDLLDEATTAKLKSIGGPKRKNTGKRGVRRVTASQLEYLQEKARVLRLREAGSVK